MIILIVLHLLSGYLGFYLMKSKTKHFNQFTPHEVKVIIPLAYTAFGFFTLLQVLIYLKFNKNK